MAANSDTDILLQDMNAEHSTGSRPPVKNRTQIKDTRPSSGDTYWTTFLRALRLQIIHNRTSEHYPEEPKIAIRSSKRAALIRSFIHIPPIVGAIVLIAINCRTVFYHGDTFWASALQFVAKAHEMMMISSIAAIALAYFRHQFVMLGDAPFGALFPALQVSQLSSLWSIELWATATSSSFDSHRKAVFITFISFCILLAASVGPSSAIAMVPRVSTFRAATATQTFESFNEIDIYPEQLSGDDLCDCSIPQTCDSTTICAQCTNITFVSERGSNCPAIDWQSLIELEQSTSYIMQIPGNDWTRNIVLNMSPDNTPIPSTTTTQSALVAEIFSVFSNRWWDPTVSTFDGVLSTQGAASAAYVSMTDQRNFSSTMQLTATAKQPYVYSDCRPFTALANNTGLVQFGTAGKPAIQDPRLSMGDVAMSSRSNPYSHVIWLEPSGANSSNISILATLVMSQNYSEFISLRGNAFTEVTLAAACIIKAAWVPSTFSSTSEKLNPHGIIAEAKVDDAVWGGPHPTLVAITTTWADLALPPVGVLSNAEQIAGNPWSNFSMLDVLLGESTLGSANELIYDCWSNSAFDGTDNCQFAQDILSGVITLGMAQIHIAETSTYNTDEELVSLERAGPSSGQNYSISATLWISGPMYSLEGFPIKLAIAILAIYCFFAITAVVYFIVDGTSSTSWDSISELTALALNSERPTVLQNTSAGIAKIETFRHRVSIQAKQGQGLQFVFESDEGKNGLYKRVQKNISY